LKSMPERALVKLEGKIVSAAYQGFFYIQEPDGYQGIRVSWPGSVTEGALVSVSGVLRTRDGEREIAADSVAQGTYVGSVRPVGMAARSLGGSDFGAVPPGQRGVSGAVGPNNIGTLVKICGRITQIGSGYFYVDDGSGVEDGTLTGSEQNVGVRILWPGTGLSPGQFVTVVGISSGFMDEGRFLRLVLPRRESDVGQ